MIELRKDGLLFSFPDVHPEARCSVVFQRTLRVPGYGGPYPVPPGLGRFSLERVDEYRELVPASWKKGGVFFPVYQSEALLVIFVGWYPFAIRVTVGGMNAVTGRKSGDEGCWRPQDYVVIPRRPWMEWFCVGNGKARQFVAMPLREGNASGESRGRRNEGGEIRITAHPMRSASYREYRAHRSALMSNSDGVEGLWGGALLGKPIVGSDAALLSHFRQGSWETTAESWCSVYPVNSLDFMKITGSAPPGRPPTRREYREAGLPWFGEYGRDLSALGRAAQA